MIYFWILVSVSLGALAQIMMKEAMKIAGPFPGMVGVRGLIEYFSGAILTWPVVGAIGCYGLSFFVWLAVLSRSDLTLARPFVSIGYIIIIVYGYYAGERMSFDRIFGIALIAAGLFFVARSGSSA